MAQYNAIKAAVNAYIKANGRKEITGQILNSVLNATIDSLGRFFQFAGEAYPSTDPGTPDQNVTYLAGTAGTYTNFGGLTLDPQEIALLMWDGEWRKHTMLIGIQEVEASVDNQVGTPSVDVNYANGHLDLAFHNMKGDQGNPGASAGFGSVTADVDANIGTPGVSVVTSGADTAKNFTFHFTNLKGQKGDTGVTAVTASVDNNTGVPYVEASLSGQTLVLAFHNMKGQQGDTGSSVSYPFTLVNNVTTNDATQALTAAMGVYLQTQVDDINDELLLGGEKIYSLTELADLRVSDQGGGNIKITSNSGGHLFYAKVKSGAVVTINYSINSGQYYRRGFTTNVPALNVTGNNYKVNASSVTSDSITAPSDGYVVVDCSAGFNTLTMKSTIPGNTIGKEVAQLKADMSSVEDSITDIDGAINNTETRNGKVISGIVYSLSVGNAPTENSSSWYNAVKVVGLKSGDTIRIRAKAGSSYPTYAKLSGGVVTWASANNADVDTTITCDGTFDTIITNSYSSYVPSPYCIVTHNANIVNEGRELRVLAIGNSFSEDSMGYIPGIVKKVCPLVKLTIGIAYMGGSPLAQHYAYFSGQDVTLGGKTYKTDNGQYQRIDTGSGTIEFSGLYTYYKSVDGGAWTSKSATIQQFLDDECWDIITFQQNGANVNSDWDTYYAPYIYALQKSLYGKITYPVRLGWVLVHGAYGANHAENLAKWEGGAENAEKVMSKTGCSIIIPYGTAVQNLRTTSLASLGDGTAHDLLADTAHLQDGIGCLTATYTYILAIMRAKGIPGGLVGEMTKIDATFLSTYNVPGQNVGNGIIGISDANLFLAQVSAEKAITNPYEVTDLSVFQS